MIQSGHMKSCLAAQKRFLRFKGPGSFNKIFLIGGNVEDKQAYRLIPRTPPLPGHFTVPLMLSNSQLSFKLCGNNIVVVLCELNSIV
jgi:hypothetical protein